MSLSTFSLAPLFLAALISAPVFGQSGTSVPVTYTRDYVFPPVSLANGETAQVNVANTAKAPTNGTAASCTGMISFTNASGTATGNPISFTVASGQIFSASFPNNSASRTAILATVEQAFALTGVLAPTASAITACTLTISLEVFSSTTHVVLGNSTAVASPIPLLGLKIGN